MEKNKAERKDVSADVCLPAGENDALGLDQLMNVQGGIETDTDPVRNCGLGCYLSGIGQTTPPDDDTKRDAHGQA